MLRFGIVNLHFDEKPIPKNYSFNWLYTLMHKIDQKGYAIQTNTTNTIL